MRVGMLAALLISLGAVAQAPVDHPGLVVWRVVTVPPSRPISPPSLSPHVRSQTAGTFGQPASTAGNTAGNTGQTAGSFGQSASEIGGPAGNSGQTAGSFGRSASEIGQPAGDTGQTAGSFDGASTSFATAAARSNVTRATRRRDPDWEAFTEQVRHQFPFLNVAYMDVGMDELETRLQDTAGSSDAPDVLVGTPLPETWSQQDSQLLRRFCLVTLGGAALIPQSETSEARSRSFRVEASVLRAAPHPRNALAFAAWLYGGTEYVHSSPIPPEAEIPANIAKSAIVSILSGQGLGSAADQQAAKFDEQLAQRTALNIFSPELLTDLEVRIDAVGARADSRFAVVALRAAVENKETDGIVHALVVLRTDSSGQWRVLQITPNLRGEQQLFAWRMLIPYSANVAPQSVAKLLGVAQAAPADGDNRESAPDLWWDNRGGATLEIVEWQSKAGDSWTTSNLFFVPDETGYLRTRVTARFADASGTYRWRVWSMGRGGTTLVGSWRSLNILPH